MIRLMGNSIELKISKYELLSPSLSLPVEVVEAKEAKARLLYWDT